MKIKEEIRGQLNYGPLPLDRGVSFRVISVEDLVALQLAYPEARWRSGHSFTEYTFENVMPYYLSNDYPEDPYSFGYGDAPRFKVIQL